MKKAGLLAVLLAIVMLMSLLPMAVSAQQSVVPTSDPYSGYSGPIVDTPAAPSFDAISGQLTQSVTITCSSDSAHGSRTYDALVDGCTIGTPYTDKAGFWYVDVTLTANAYVQQYSLDTGKTHYLSASSQDSVTVTFRRIPLDAAETDPTQGSGVGPAEEPKVRSLAAPVNGPVYAWQLDAPLTPVSLTVTCESASRRVDDGSRPVATGGFTDSWKEEAEETGTDENPNTGASYFTAVMVVLAAVALGASAVLAIRTRKSRG